MNLPMMLLLLLGLAALFAELRQAPAPPEGGFVKLTPLKPKAELEREWREILGPFPEPVPLRPEVLSTEELPDHTRLLLRYHTEADATAEAYLVIPKPARARMPGMVVLHQTSQTTMRDPVGLDGREPMHMALHLVRRGYVCIAPRNFLWNDPVKGYQRITEELLASGRWKTGMAKMEWDAIRATDLLAERPEVDPKRIGAIGHSLGGKEALYHAAFDSRIAAAVSCEGGIGISFSNWDADWYLGKQVHAPGFAHDHHEVLALVAPRPFLLIGGGPPNGADGAQSWPYIEANLPRWREAGAEERLGLLLFPGGHDFPGPGPVREKVYGWLDHWLKPAG
jgi:dienelactone hydrolase